MPAPSPFAVSFVVAVTGHRDILPQDRAIVKARIEIWLCRLRNENPDTPLLLLTGLAEGADQLAAQAANDLNIPFIVVLPMPQNDYLETFEAEPGRAEYHRLLPLADRSFVLPQTKRTPPFEALACFLVNYSQAVIAVWDLNPRASKNDAIGGTAHVVELKLGQSRSRHAPAINANGLGPVYVVRSRRALGSANSAIPPEESEPRYPEGIAADEYKRVYKLQNRFNHDMASADPVAVLKCRERLVGIGAAELHKATTWVADTFAYADALADRFQSRSLTVWKLVFILLAAGGVFLALHHAWHKEWTLYAYWVTLTLALVFSFFERLFEWRDRHEDYRGLAEALRVQFYWMSAGLRELAADHYLRKHSGEMVWIRDAMSECGLYPDVLEHADPHPDDWSLRLGETQNWIDIQCNYFSGQCGSRGTRSKTFNWLAGICGAIGLISPIFGLDRMKLITGIDAGEWPLLIAEIAACFAAILWTYSEKRGYLQEARQFARMHDWFLGAREDLKGFQQIGKEGIRPAQESIHELGRLALEENGDWLAMHRERKLPILKN